MANYRVKKSEALKRERPTILLLDANNIFHRTAYVAVKNYSDEMKELRSKMLKNEASAAEENLYEKIYDEFSKIWKNICYSMIRNIVNTHKPNSVIICEDSGYTWRHAFFPYYKGARKIARKENDDTSAYDMTRFYVEIEKLTQELQSVLKYHTLKCVMCEADDIIGVLSQTLSKEYDIIISSTDKDFADLITDDESVKFWEHNKKCFLTPDDKMSFDEMICMGDVADGIPRLFDSDDSIVMFNENNELIKSPSYMRPRFGIVAARKILKKCEDAGVTLEEYCEYNGFVDNYMRNRALFSLRIEDFEKYCPMLIDTVKEEFLNLKTKTQSFTEMQKYFATNRLVEQINHIEEFILPTF